MSDLTQADVDSNASLTAGPCIEEDTDAPPSLIGQISSGSGADGGLTESFSRIVSLTDWVNNGHRWTNSENQEFEFHRRSPYEDVDFYGSGREVQRSRVTQEEPLVPATLLRRGTMQSPTMEAAGGGAGPFSKGRMGPRTSVSSMSSSGGASVQSPPGFDDKPASCVGGGGGGFDQPLMPAPMPGQHVNHLMASGHHHQGASGGRTTPSSFNHFRFPSVPQPTSVRMLPSQRLGLTPSPIGMGRGRMPRPQYNFCVFCKNNGEDEKFYMKHTLKDDSGLVRCPVLCNYVCPICGATGKIAHTIRYCPKNKDDRYHDNYAPITMLKEMRSSTGKPRSSESVESMFYPESEPGSAAQTAAAMMGTSAAAMHHGGRSAPATGGAGLFRPVLGQPNLQPNTPASGTRRNSTNSPNLFDYHMMSVNQQRQQPF